MGKEHEPYLYDIKIGDRLYSFLEKNREYIVTDIDENEHAIYRIKLRPLDVLSNDAPGVYITNNGALHERWNTPVFLYRPVDILDPRNLPEKPWKPEKDEYVWARLSGTFNEYASWELVKFYQETSSGKYLCYKQFRDVRTPYHEIAPFKGELPPGLEEEK